MIQEVNEQYVQFIVVDLFCGAGGTTLGFEQAEMNYEDLCILAKSAGIDPPPNTHLMYKVAKVVACVNHDHTAIQSHWRNHPDVEHFEDDIRLLDPYCRLKELITECREKYKLAKVILFASLECINFSKAKGGQARDQDSRTLACELYRYIDALNPDFIMIENVVEFMAWGPLKIKVVKEKGTGYESCPLRYKKIRSAEGGQRNRKFQYQIGPSLVPESKNNGKDWLKWRERVRAFGYHDEWRQINSADFGALTARNRLFGCFAKHGLPIVWPTPTHAKKPGTTTMVEPLRKWNAVKPALDFTDVGKSIFNRTKDLSPKSWERIYKGCVKHIAGGHQNLIARRKNSKLRYVATENPNAAVADQTAPGNATHTQSHFIVKAFGGSSDNKSIGIESPAGAITTKDHHQLVNASFITKYNGTDKRTGEAHAGHSIDEPCPVIATQNRLGIVNSSFIQKYYSTGGQHNSIDEPGATVTTKDRLNLVQAHFINQQFSSGKQNQSVESPLGAITTVPKSNLVVCQYLDKSYGGSDNHQSIDVPAGSITTKDHYSLVSAKQTKDPSKTHHFLINPAWYNEEGARSIDEPCFVVVARQDKTPIYLINCQTGNVAVPVYESDCEYAVKVKEFMALYGISDIFMRMLKVFELKRIQGFPDEYILLGSQTAQKKFIGNAVVPLIPKVWIETFSARMLKPYLRSAA